MPRKSVEVKKLTISVGAISALSDQERHFYYLTGLIYNEICCLRKLISYSIPRHRDRRPFRREAEFSQTFLLMRIAGAKVYEAWQRLNEPGIQSVLRSDVFPHWMDGPDALKTFNRRVAATKWLAKLRNKTAFHYPALEDCRAVITPNSKWQEDAVYFGGEPGNMYFDAPEQQMRELMFGRGVGVEPSDRMYDVVSALVDITTLLGDFVERAQLHFATARLLKGEEAISVGRVISSPLDEVELPFWIAQAATRKMQRSSPKNRSAAGLP